MSDEVGAARRRRSSPHDAARNVFSWPPICRLAEGPRQALARLGDPLRLALLTSIVLILIFCGYGIATALIGEHNRESLRLEAVAEMQAHQIADWLRERQGDADLVRTSPTLPEEYRRWRTGADPEAAASMQARLTRLLMPGGFEAVRLYDADGPLVWTSLEPTPDTRPELATGLREAERARQSRRVGPYLDAGQRPHLDYVVPLAANAEPLAFVVLHADPEGWLYPTLRTWPNLTKSGESFLFRRDGDQVRYLSPLRFHADAALKLRLPVAGGRLLAARLLRGEISGDEVLQGIDYRGEPVLGVAHSIAGTDWFLATKLDLAEIRANAGLEITVIGLAGLLALLIAIAGTRMVRHSQQLALATATQEAQAERLATLGRLRETEQRFLSTFEQAAVGIAQVAPDGRWLRVNQRLCEIVGYDEAELLNRTFQDITHPDDLNRDLDQVRQMLSGEIDTYSLEKRYLRKDGDDVWINLTVSLVRKDSGEPDYFISVVEDIQARKLAESRLALWNNAFEKAELNLAIGDAVHQRLLAVNPAFAARRGYRPEEMVDMPVAALFPPDRLEEVLAQAREADARGHHLFETEHQCKNGERFPVLLDITVTHSDDGRQATRIVHALDISARLAAVAARRESEERLREAQRIAGLGHWEWDLRADRHRWSEDIYQIYGRDPGLPPAQYPEVARYFTPESWAGLTRAVEQALAEGTAYQYDAEVVRPDGSHRWITARGEAVRDTAGQPILLRGTVQDISARKEAEQALRESEERLRLFIEHAPAALAMFDREMRYLAVSHRWLEDYSLLDVDLLGRSHYAVFPEIGESLKAVHRRGLAGEVIRADEDRFERADGRVHWVRWEMHPWYQTDGVAGGILIFTEDITARKLAELDLRESQRRFQDIVDASADWVWEVDAQGRFTYTSESVHDVLGYSAEEILGKTPFDLMPAEEAARVADEFAGISARRVPFRDLENLNRHKDGRLLYIHSSGMPILDAAGELLGYRGLDRDVTEKRQAELALLESQELLRTLFSSLPDLVWLKDPNGVYLACNPRFERLFGAAETEIVGKTDYDFVDRELADFFRANDLAAIAAAGPSCNEEEVIFASDGHRELVQSIKTPIYDAGGQVIGVLGIARDITHLKRNEEELERHRHHLEELVTARTAELMQARAEAERLAQAKGEFLANMSHEIRTPMNAVLGLAYLLERQDLPAEARELAHKIRQSGRGLLAIINDILDFSKIESGRVEIERVPFQLGEVLDALATVMTTTAADKAIELVIQPPDCLDRTLLGDPLRLGQVLTNLTSNAIKFTPAGMVEVRIDRLDRNPSRIALRFSVRDTGIGIDPQARARLFQPFTQADASTTRRFGGSGLGLVISRRLVELMGGRMGLESVVGEGSTFWLELTFDLAEPNPTARLRGAPMRVLIADDNPIVRGAAAITVEALGWSATQAESGDQALRKVLQEPGLQGPGAVVLLDWRMPGLDGLATARAIRDALSADSVPLLFLFTAHPIEAVRTLSGVEAVNGVLAKPLTPSMLYDAVLAELARRLGTSSVVVSPATAERRLNGIRMLVVDDSDINRDVARRIFAGEGAEVHLAGDGREAVDWLVAHPDAVDIVLMDVHMPVMDGHEATRLIRQTPEIARLPVVALTADALQDREAVALDAGMSAFLSKPFEVPEAVALIRCLTGHAPGAPEKSQLTPTDGDPGARGAASGEGDDRASMGADALTPSRTSPDEHTKLDERRPDEAPDPAFPGIALDQGLALWSDAAIYRQYLRRFAHAYADSAGVIATAEPNSARQLAHKLRGTAGNLGLTEVAARAGVLEGHLGQGATTEAGALVAALREALDTALDSIARYAPEEPRPLSATPESAPSIRTEPVRAQLALLLRQVLAACERFDPMAAGPAMEALSKHLPAAYLAPLRLAIEDFDTPAGAALARALASELDISLED